MTKTQNTRRSAPPVSPDKLREELNTSIQGCLADPLYNEVVSHIHAHDAAIEAGGEGKALGWVLDALQTPAEQVMRHKRMIETACRVFHGILQTIGTEAEKAAAGPQIELTLEMAADLDQWANAGWESHMQGFVREARGMNPAHLTDRIGFTAEQVEVVDGTAKVSISDIVFRIVSDPKTVEDKRFRRFALNAMAAFFRHAFGQTGSTDTELLDIARSIDVSLYGEAKVAEREAERGKPAVTQPSNNSNGTGRKSPSKRRAQERGKKEYEDRMAAPERKRGYEQVGGRKGK